MNGEIRHAEGEITRVEHPRRFPTFRLLFQMQETKATMNDFGDSIARKTLGIFLKYFKKGKEANKKEISVVVLHLSRLLLNDESLERLGKGRKNQEKRAKPLKEWKWLVEETELADLRTFIIL